MMRQRDWARVFGIGCAAGAVALSVGGAQWEAFILLLGALMLLRGAVEVPVASRAEGVVRALALILLIFAFSAVNRAQDGAAGAVAGVFGNWILWAVGALLIALPLFRRGLGWGLTGPRIAMGAAMATVLLALALWPGEDGLRLLVVVAVAAQVALILPQERGLAQGLALAVAAALVAVAPGGTVWPVAVALLPLGAGVGLWAGRSAKKDGSPPAGTR